MFHMLKYYVSVKDTYKWNIASKFYLNSIKWIENLKSKCKNNSTEQLIGLK